MDPSERLRQQLARLEAARNAQTAQWEAQAAAIQNLQVPELWVSIGSERLSRAGSELVGFWADGVIRALRKDLRDLCKSYSDESCIALEEVCAFVRDWPLNERLPTWLRPHFDYFLRQEAGHSLTTLPCRLWHGFLLAHLSREVVGMLGYFRLLHITNKVKAYEDDEDEEDEMNEVTAAEQVVLQARQDTVNQGQQTHPDDVYPLLFLYASEEVRGEETIYANNGVSVILVRVGPPPGLLCIEKRFDQTNQLSLIAKEAVNQSACYSQTKFVPLPYGIIKRPHNFSILMSYEGARSLESVASFHHRLKVLAHLEVSLLRLYYRGLQHGDLHPRNLRVVDDPLFDYPVPCLLDFGQAEAVADAGPGARHRRQQGSFMNEARERSRAPSYHDWGFFVDVATTVLTRPQEGRTEQRSTYTIGGLCLDNVSYRAALQGYLLALFRALNAQHPTYSEYEVFQCARFLLGKLKVIDNSTGETTFPTQIPINQGHTQEHILDATGAVCGVRMRATAGPIAAILRISAECVREIVEEIEAQEREDASRPDAEDARPPQAPTVQAPPAPRLAEGEGNATRREQTVQLWKPRRQRKSVSDDLPAPADDDEQEE